MGSALLAKFKFKNDVANLKDRLKNCTFEIYGDYKIIKNEKDANKNNYWYPDFDNLEIVKIANGVKEPFLPDGENWYGHKTNVNDVMNNFIESLIIEDMTMFEKVYLDKDLENLVDFYTKDRVEIDDASNSIPKRILNLSSIYTCYNLSLVTNDFTYYSCDDTNIMLRTSDRSTVTACDYWAERGLFLSLDSIGTGEEKLLYGQEFYDDYFEPLENPITSIELQPKEYIEKGGKTTSDDRDLVKQDKEKD